MIIMHIKRNKIWYILSKPIKNFFTITRDTRSQKDQTYQGEIFSSKFLHSKKCLHLKGI